MGRILIGAIVGGILVFAWGAVSHMLIPLAQVAVQPLSADSQVVAALRSSVSEPGVYVYPGIDTEASPSEEEQAAWESSYELGPRGLIVFHAGGDAPMSPKFFGIELASNVLAALLAALVVSASAAGFTGRVVTVTVMGLFAWISIDLSYWTWYGFSTDFVLADAVDQLGGWLLAGIALALIVPKRHARRS